MATTLVPCKICCSGWLFSYPGDVSVKYLVDKSEPNLLKYSVFKPGLRLAASEAAAKRIGRKMALREIDRDVEVNKEGRRRIVAKLSCDAAEALEEEGRVREIVVLLRRFGTELEDSQMVTRVKQRRIRVTAKNRDREQSGVLSPEILNGSGGSAKKKDKM